MLLLSTSADSIQIRFSIKTSVNLVSAQWGCQTDIGSQTHLMEEILHKGGFSLGGRPAQHVSNHNGLHMDDLAVKLHALEHAVQHLRQRCLGSRLVHSRAAHQEDVVACPHRQQQRLRSTRWEPETQSSSLLEAYPWSKGRKAATALPKLTPDMERHREYKERQSPQVRIDPSDTQCAFCNSAPGHAGGWPRRWRQ